MEKAKDRNGSYEEAQKWLISLYGPGKRSTVARWATWPSATTTTTTPTTPTPTTPTTTTTTTTTTTIPIFFFPSSPFSASSSLLLSYTVATPNLVSEALNGTMVF